MLEALNYVQQRKLAYRCCLIFALVCFGHFIYLYVLGRTEWINTSALDKQGSSVWRCKKKGLDVLLMFVFYKAIISELLLFFNKSFF